MIRNHVIWYQLKLYILLLSVTSIAHTTHAHNQRIASRSELQSKFAHTLLVIHFNHPYYNNIAFLKELYAPFFSHIVFYGEKAHPDVNTITTHTGYVFTRVVTDTLERYPGFDGYLFLQDDCILNIWQCVALDLKKIWLPNVSHNPKILGDKPTFHIANFVEKTQSNNWQWWQSYWGFTPLKKAISRLQDHDLLMLEKSFGKDNAGGSATDMFYIPGSHSREALRLSKLFDNTFVEIAVPCILCCLEHIDNWEKTTILWGVHEKELRAHWPTTFTCVHPLKLSNPAHRIMLTTIFNERIAT